VTPNVETILTQRQIESAICGAASAWDRVTQDKPKTLIVVLEGGFRVGAEWLKHLTGDVRLGFCRASSYYGIERGDKVELDPLCKDAIITERSVMVVDDVLDSGRTLQSVIDWIDQKRPYTCDAWVLADKEIDDPTEIACGVTCGFRVPNRFLVGYGMDVNGAHRHWNDLYALRNQ